MTEALIVSSLLGWLATAGLALAVWALARQIGVLHERIKPVGALALGQAIKAGEAAPLFNLPSLSGGAVRLGGVSDNGQSTLLFFLSDTCPVCKTLLPVLKSLQASALSNVRVVLASDGDEAAHQAFIRAQQLADFPYLLSREVGMAYQISKLPYAVLIDASGSVAAHGLVNTREHLESLFEAQALGFATIQALRAAQPQAAGLAHEVH
jgi:methylamine dehydrogenase accessory protein MauD